MRLAQLRGQGRVLATAGFQRLQQVYRVVVNAAKQPRAASRSRPACCLGCQAHQVVMAGTGLRRRVGVAVLRAR